MLNHLLNQLKIFINLYLLKREKKLLPTFPSHKNIKFYIDGWEMKETLNVQTGLSQFTEEIYLTDSERYLGQIISSDGSNTCNITSRCNKGIGMSQKVIQMLHSMPGGKYQFEIAVIYRNAYLISRAGRLYTPKCLYDVCLMMSV